MNFTAWILTIVGVVFLTLIVDIILPDGETNKYIKSIFAIVTVLVIAAPIPGLLNSDFEMGNIFGENTSVTIDENYLESVFQMKCAYYEQEILSELEAEGITGVEFNFVPYVEGYTYSVGSVFVNTKNIVIQDENRHINASEKILEILNLAVGVSGQRVVFL